MKIGLDVDEVLAHLHEPWILWGNKKFGTDLSLTVGFTHWNHPLDLWGPAGFEFLHSKPYERQLVKPYRHAPETVARLRRLGHEIHFVTAVLDDDPRGALALEKFDWLEAHNFAPYVGRYHIMRNKGKAPVDLLVDDNPTHCEEFGLNRSVLMRRSHNADYDGEVPVIANIYDLLNAGHLFT